MKLYSCKVRLGGSLYNEVPKIHVTAAEVAILRVLHGGDAVSDIKETGKNKTGHTDERERLLEIYGGGLVAAQLAKTPIQALASIFGIAAPLPDDIPGAPKAAKEVTKVEPVADETDEPEKSLEA